MFVHINSFLLQQLEIVFVILENKKKADVSRF